MVVLGNVYEGIVITFVRLPMDDVPNGQVLCGGLRNASVGPNIVSQFNEVSLKSGLYIKDTLCTSHLG